MLDLGIKVKVDLIIGLPGDTVDSVRRGIEYVRRSRLYSQAQVFNLAVLPGTSFRQEAEQLGLVYQDRPPYYVLQTPTLSTSQMYDLMAEAEDAFETEFDPLPEPTICESGTTTWKIDLDSDNAEPPIAADRAQAFTLWLQSSDIHGQRQRAAGLIEQLLEANPFTTLQIVLEPMGETELLTPATCETLLRAAFRKPTYLDRFYSVQPGRIKGAKRLVVSLARTSGERIDPAWLEMIGEYATVVLPEATSLRNALCACQPRRDQATGQGFEP